MKNSTKKILVTLLLIAVLLIATITNVKAFSLPSSTNETTNSATESNSTLGSNTASTTNTSLGANTTTNTTNTTNTTKANTISSSTKDDTVPATGEYDTYYVVAAMVIVTLIGATAFVKSQKSI